MSCTLPMVTQNPVHRTGLRVRTLFRINWTLVGLTTESLSATSFDVLNVLAELDSGSRGFSEKSSSSFVSWNFTCGGFCCCRGSRWRLSGYGGENVI